ncbi:MAG: NAD(P)H-dependent oxidoreductase [Bauldia sp.]|nr:NAD(P)H-dependent oxidoreductase [Bauldia sp.]
MRVLVIFAHPVETSFGAAVHATVVEGLRAAGHEVDDCDLYAEGFLAAMSREQRIVYQDVGANRAEVEPYVRRLLAAEALVFVHPVWNFGYPAILKGFLDRVFLPGVSFEMVDRRARPSLRNIRKCAFVCTYGGSRFRAWLMGDPPRRLAKRHIRVTIRPGAPLGYYAHYDMNRSTPESRQRFLDRVGAAMRSF